MLHPFNPAAGGAPAAGGNWIHIQTIDAVNAPVTFNAGIAGNDASVIGYWLGGTIISDDNLTQVGIKYNNDVGLSHNTTRTDNDSLVLSVANVPNSTEFPLHPPGAPVPIGDQLNFWHWIPISIASGAFQAQGIKSFSMATNLTGEGSDALWIAAHRYAPQVQLTRIDVVAIAGGFDPGTRVSLYKLTR